jgi:hypothetical protein
MSFPHSRLQAAIPPPGGGNDMGTTSLQAVIGALAALGLTCVGPIASAAQGLPATALGLDGSGIRTDSPVLGTLIRDASERSQTFRALVAAIEATDGLVYLRVGTCGRLRACLLHQISVAGPHRVLSIIVDAQHHDLSLMGAIGHELQHALEVLGDPRIRTDAALFAFYRLHGLKMKGVIETRAAIAVGDAVRDEIRRSIATAPVR